MTLQIVNTENKKVAAVELGAALTEKPNKAVLYYAVKAARNNLRRGTAKTKGRSDVSMTNKKIYRQKGTGNARHAARSANIFVGGGNVFGPLPRSYNEKVNKKFKQASYRETIKYLVQNDHLRLLDQLSFAKPSTKAATKVLKNLGLEKALVILPQTNVNAIKSFRNIKDVKVIHESNLNAYDMLNYEDVIMTAEFFANLKERYSL